MTTRSASARALSPPVSPAPRRKVRPTRASSLPSRRPDRKPVDPPPIIQLRIKNDTDPAQYVARRPDPTASADAPTQELPPESVLLHVLQPLRVPHRTSGLRRAPDRAGWHLSLLAASTQGHRQQWYVCSSAPSSRLTRASDGGFFVFGDLSVKIEGDFRLRFSLFEMLKSEVVHIKSVISDPFTGESLECSREPAPS